MGIYDREYVRMGPRSKSGLGSVRFISFNSWLIIINIAVFLLNPMLAGLARPVIIRLQMERDVPRSERLPMLLGSAPKLGGVIPAAIIDRRDGSRVGMATCQVMTPLQEFGHFSSAMGFWALQVWRFVTFQFLHADIWHLVFNMIGLWVFGGMVEQFLGFKRYAAFYLVCGICGAISYLILNVLGAGLGLQLPGVLVENPFTPLVGASAGVFGVILACAFIAPDAIVLVYLIPLKLKLFAYGYVIIAAWNLLKGGHNAGGDAAHVGGAIAGFFFIRNAHLLRDFFDIVGDSRKNQLPAARGRHPEEAEVDRILAKVKADGLQSLSAEEKSILRRASRRRGLP